MELLGFVFAASEEETGAWRHAVAIFRCRLQSSQKQKGAQYTQYLNLVNSQSQT